GLLVAPAGRVGDGEAGERAAAGKRRDARALELDFRPRELRAETVDARLHDVAEVKRDHGAGDNAEGEEAAERPEDDFFHGRIWLRARLAAARGVVSNGIGPTHAFGG